MSDFSSILPGTRVRGPDGFVGTVEQLTRQGTQGGGQPDTMLVRSDDGQWRYAIPLLLVSGLSQEMLHPVVNLRAGADELRHYIAGPIEQAGERATSGRADRGADLVVPLAEEELAVQKLPAQVGSVRVHKGVETVEQRLTVPVYHEEAVVERIAPDQYDGQAPTAPNEIIVPVLEERLVVRKEIVITEYIRIRKQLMQNQQTVADTVRRETVSVFQTRTDDPSASGSVPIVDVRGAGEPAGARDRPDVRPSAADA